jgi:hypothetical protein
VAVIQISRIQQRRGQKLATGIPQLSSAELAWAVDTQELFIGNGSVAEGAPYVGNTRILTEHSNIFQDAVYQFMSTDPEITSSVPRKAQSKLDEYVSVLDFIEKDTNGNISWADTFEAAVNDLCASSHNYRKVLIIPNGTYTFTRDVYIQSGAILRGESQDNVILNVGSHCLVTGLSSDIKLQNFNLTGSSMVLDITGLTNGSISDITFTGTFDNTNSSNFHNPAVWWNNSSISTKVDNVEFLNCTFDTTNTSVLVTQTTAFETNIKFDSCIFTNCYRGIAVNGIVGQSNRWVINDCSFSDVYDSAIIVSRGKNMVVRNSTFYRCGNGIGTADTPISIVILFGDVDNNLVIDCSCDRRRAVGLSVSGTTNAVSDAENCNIASFVDYIPVDIITGNTNATAFTNFNSTTDFITIDYSLIIGQYIRNGQLQVLVGDLVANPTSLACIDNYLHSAPAYNINGPDLTQQFEFSVDSTPNLSSVIIKYTNGSGNLGSLVYKVTYGSAQVSIIPMQFGVTPGNHQILVDWNPNASPSGSPVTGFSLSVS